jgi:ABC-2 type transport system permease protein
VSGQAARTGLPERRPSARRPWLVVFREEAFELWVGGRAVSLLILYSILVSLTTFLIATNSELSLIPPKEMALLTLQNAIFFGVFIGMIVGADSISGERERGTLEVLLLTPASRRQLVLGKLLAALTPWPAALVIAIPALVVVSQGNDVLREALWLGTVVGTVLAVAFAGFGLLVSAGSNSNKVSIFVSTTVWLLMFLLTQLPGDAQKGDLGYLIQRINPMQATSALLEKVLVGNSTVTEMSPYLWSSVLALVTVLVLLFLVAAPRLRVVAGPTGGRRGRWRASGSMAAAALVLFGLAAGLTATGSGPAFGAPMRQDASTELTLSIGETAVGVKAGDALRFDSFLANLGAADSPPVILALNIISLDGEVVDPEDWSPERTQEVSTVAAGDTVRSAWQVDAILKGDYLVYLVAVPEPADTATGSAPVASNGLHLTVAPFTQLNPEGVLPVVILVPLGVAALGLLVLRRRVRGLAADDAVPDSVG